MTTTMIDRKVSIIAVYPDHDSAKAAVRRIGSRRNRHEKRVDHR